VVDVAGHRATASERPVGASGLDDIIGLLACPHCGEALDRPAESVVGCAAGHRFDIARQGYLSLLGKGSRTDTADSAEMVAARVAFLAAGHYRPIADAIAGLVREGPVLEIGAGTGYYLGAVLDRPAKPGVAGAAGSSPDARTNAGSSVNAVGIALDASRYAARRAVGAHPRIGSIVADAWAPLPVRDGVVGTVMSVFAPRDAGEIARVLRPRLGRLVVVTPEPDHLAEIRSDLGLLTVDAGKPARLAESFAGRLRPVQRSELRRRMALTRNDVLALVLMGPAARHVRPDQLRMAVGRLADITTVTLAVTISVLEAS
jgi:23S rRNA (guanine745-N1)-methyltransferase